MKKYYARVDGDRVIRIAHVKENWIDRNPWPDVPGQWIECGPDTSINDVWDQSTNTFTKLSQ